ncbi:MAG TPA: SEC-C metal-binding domain-containing protein, partial [Polyangiales bacterium]|nr:SEC-C metal-binding domain-containing protein [Polyangiales bacterium]
MPKTGRNEPCPCGSGKKYKHCCLPKNEEAERIAFAERKAVAEQEQRERERAVADHLAHVEAQLDEDASLADDSNAVIELVHTGRLEEAERAARELLVRYPYVHDGYDRLGMVYEARGQNREAADCYRKVIDFVTAHPDQYEPDFAQTFH